MDDPAYLLDDPARGPTISMASVGDGLTNTAIFSESRRDDRPARAGEGSAHGLHG
jgi:hypothetical protein